MRNCKHTNTRCESGAWTQCVCPDVEHDETAHGGVQGVEFCLDCGAYRPYESNAGVVVEADWDDCDDKTSESGLYDAEGEDWDLTETEVRAWRVGTDLYAVDNVDQGTSNRETITAGDTDMAMQDYADSNGIVLLEGRDQDYLIEKIRSQRLVGLADDLRTMLERPASRFASDPSDRTREIRDCTECGVDVDLYRLMDGRTIAVCEDVSRWQGSTNEKGWAELDDEPCTTEEAIATVRADWEARSDEEDRSSLKWTVVESYTVR